MRDLDDIVNEFQNRQRRDAAKNLAVRDFNAFLRDEKPVPLPELDRVEQSGIANLAALGLDQLSERAGSVLPDEHWPSAEPGDPDSDRRARTRRRASIGWSEQNAMAEVLVLRASHLLAHAETPVSVLPGKDGMPEWLVRQPESVFLASCANPLEIAPADAIIAHSQTYAWLEKRYGDKVKDLKRSSMPSIGDRLLHLVYVDDEQITNICLSDIDGYGTTGSTKAVLLDTTENLANRPLVFSPSLVSASGRRGQFAGTVGIHQMRAKIASLAYITASKGASPDVYIERTEQGVDPEVIAPYDPRTGAPGMVDGRIRTIDVNPSNTSLAILSILEREMRNAGGIPAALTGEAPTTVQTGRLSQGLLANAIDFVVQKVHRKFERSLSLEKQAAVDVVKGFTSGPKSYYVSWKGARGQVTYDPQTDFEVDTVVVSYPLAGSDLNNLLMRNQGKLATGTLSRRSFLENDPETKDADEEIDRLALQQVDDRILGMLLARVEDPTSGVTLDDLIEFRDSIAKPDVSVSEAAKKITEAIKERQANPPEPESVEAMPGTEPMLPAEPEGPPDLSATSAVLAQLRSVGRGAAA